MINNPILRVRTDVSSWGQHQVTMGSQNTAKKEIEYFTVPPERYISTPTEVLTDDLLGTAPT